MTGLRLPRTIPATLITIMVIALSLNGCGDDNGNGPVDPGAVSGVVLLPSTQAAAGDPVEGATVTLTATDLDTSVTTGADGRFLFAPVPIGNASVEASFGTCLRAARDNITVLENDTTDIVLELVTDAEVDSFTVGWTGATQMDISPAHDRIVLLYNAAAHGGTPGIASLDLSNGLAVRRDLTDLNDVFDVKFVSSDLVVFNYREGNNYRVRFVDPVTLETSGNDVFYHTASVTQHDGRMVVLPGGHDVFVTHGTREVITKVTGWVYCISVTQRNLNDADDNAFDLDFGFSNDLVGGSLRWAYNIGYDPARNEILVGNRDTTYVTAIALSHWGTFDREAALSIPTDGVRHIQLRPAQVHVDQGYSVREWGFGGGSGIAMSTTLGSRSAILRYTSGMSNDDLFLLDTNSIPASANHVLKVMPERNSWFSIFRDKKAGFSDDPIAVEERSLTTLERVYRYQTQFLSFDAATPTAFTFDAAANLLYVAYKEREWIEVYCLP